MAKQYPKEARTIAGELAFEGLDAAEITRRFNKGEAGLMQNGEPLPIDVKYRRVREWVADYEAEHGPPPDPQDADMTPDTFNRLRRRITARIGKEIETYEKRRPGSLKEPDVGRLKALFLALDTFELKTEHAEGRVRKRKPSKRQTKEQSAKEPGREETAAEMLAREAREAARPLSTTSHPSATKVDMGKEATLGLNVGQGGEGENGGEGKPLAESSTPPPAPPT